MYILVTILSRLRTARPRNWGFHSWQGKKLLSYSQRLDRLWDPPSPLPSGSSSTAEMVPDVLQLYANHVHFREAKSTREQSSSSTSLCYRNYEFMQLSIPLVLVACCLTMHREKCIVTFMYTTIVTIKWPSSLYNFGTYEIY
jgi:hypothetical protein